MIKQALLVFAGTIFLVVFLTPSEAGPETTNAAPEPTAPQDVVKVVSPVTDDGGWNSDEGEEETNDFVFGEPMVSENFDDDYDDEEAISAKQNVISVHKQTPHRQNEPPPPIKRALPEPLA